MRSKAAFAFLFFALPILLTADQVPAFDVASIRPTEHGRSNPEAAGVSFVRIVDSGRLQAQNSSLDELIRYAWKLKDNEISGPVWLNDDTIAFDVVASAPAGTTDDQMRVMLQTLLAERFRLRAHRETRTVSGYELLPDSRGVKLTAANPEGHRSTGGGFGINATKVTMSEFADYLARNLKMPVADKTGIPGTFDIHFLYADDPDPNSPPSLFDALKQSTGLKLQPAQLPVKVLVVDHVEKSPTSN